MDQGVDYTEIEQWNPGVFNYKWLQDDKVLDILF